MLILTLCGAGAAWFGGKLPNQTATFLAVQSFQIQSLIPNQAEAYANLILRTDKWNIEGQNASTQNSYDKFTVSGIYVDETSPLMTATQKELELDLTKTPLMHLVISSKPDSRIRLYLGWLYQNLGVAEAFVQDHPEVVAGIENDDRIVWVNIAYPLIGESIDDNIHHITINTTERLATLGLTEQHFRGLRIAQYLVGSASPAKHYQITIESVAFLGEPPYQIIPEKGQTQALPDGSTVHIIKRDQIENYVENCPFVQRIYVLYTMDAPTDTSYTIFLLSRAGENLTAVRAGFVFVHSHLLNIVGTHIDWRRPIQPDSDFEPIATLKGVMEDGDFAIIFTPLKGSTIERVQLHKAEFTFSKLPYSSFVLKSLNEQVVVTMSLFLLTTAGIVPTVLLLFLFHARGKNKLRDNKITTLAIVAVGLALRLIVAPISAYNDDLQIFSEIGALYYGSGVLGAQWVSFPGFVYIQTLAYLPYALLRAGGFQDFQSLALAIYSTEALFVKLPAILGDLGSFYFIRKMAGKYAPGEKILLPALFLLNPLTVYVSGILGQFDSIFTFAVIASIYYLVAEHDSAKATIFSSFASIINIVGVAIFIPLLANAKLRENWKTVAKILLLATCIFVIAMLPFFFETKSPLLLASYERLLSGVPGEAFYGKQIRFYTYGTLISSSVGYGLTFRFLLEILGFQLGSIFYPYGAAFAFFAFAGIFIYKIHKKYKTGSRDVAYTGIFMLGVASLFQLVFPTIFDQFVVWIAGLLLVSYILCRDRTFLAIFALISVATGFVYVLTWRNYLLLVSGVETVALVNPYVSNVASSLIGALYSLLLFIILAKILRVLTKNNRKANSDMHEMS
jgi:hypothetical protein